VSMLVAIDCKECKGTGLTGKISLYNIMCRRCGGDGIAVTDYFTVIKGTEVL